MQIFHNFKIVINVSKLILLLSFRTTLFCPHDLRKLLIFGHFLCWFCWARNTLVLFCMSAGNLQDLDKGFDDHLSSRDVFTWSPNFVFALSVFTSTLTLFTPRFGLRGKWKKMFHCWKFCLRLRLAITPLVGLIAQIRKKRKSWKLLKLLLFHACLARLPSDWQKYGE